MISGARFRTTEKMGKTVEKIKIADLVDEVQAQQGTIESDRVRSLETEALVDSGATFLCLKRSLI